jgi:hypothetical protein
MWTTLNFGKHAGKTLPQVVLSDPNWFFWAVSNDVFNGPLASEAAILAHRATRVRIPKPDPKKWEVEYRWDRDGRFLGFDFIKAENPCCGSGASRLPYLDLAYVRQGSIHDKRDCRRLIRDFRHHYLGKSRNLTKRRCERFFERKSNFLAAARARPLR